MKIEKSIKLVLDVTELQSDIEVKQELIENNEIFQQDLNERLGDKIQYLLSEGFLSGEVNEEVFINEEDQVWVTGWIYF